MNFFEYQEAARRQTSRLIAFYLLAVVLIIVSLYFITAFIFHYDAAAVPDQPFNWMALWDLNLFGIVALGTGAIILSGSLYKIASLSAGGAAVAEMLNGRPIAPDTTDFQEKRLLNVVEEMAIASGTPIPRVFVMDGEEGINAFAAGFSTKDAVIAVTQGTLMQLNREELQGVIGHEFSHILNGDMRLNIRLIGVLHGILLIAITGYFMFRILGSTTSHGSSRDKKGNPLVVLVLLGLAMMIIGYIGVFFARLIKSAVSRQREFLADASAVQFTRNPTGLSGALKKIGGLATGSRLVAPSAEAASHLFFANGIASPFLGLLATHPPLAERIRRLDPQFTGELTRPSSDAQNETISAFSASDSALPALNSPLPTPPPLPPMTPAQIVKQAGTLSSMSLIHSTQALDAIPATLRTAAHQPTMAQAVIYAILLDTKPEIRQQQLVYLAKRIPTELNFDIENMEGDLRTLSTGLRQPLVEIAVGSLKHLDLPQYRFFRETIMELVATDSEVSLFEYMLLRMVLRHLDTQFGLAKPSKARITSFNTLTNEVTTVLSALAWFGSTTPAMAAQAFLAGCQELGAMNLRLLPADSASLKDMDKALDRLVDTIPPVKQKLVAACTAAINTDGTITTDERDALRAVADALDCPLPRL
ncbi:MAG: M48 family metallopeptidase [bacterium]|jgi:Zn-dependent protease with chaperone function